jgi:hypothetical protein
MPQAIDNLDTYAPTHLYLFPVSPPAPLQLFRVLLSASLASPGEAWTRLALYRVEHPIMRRTRTSLASALTFAFVAEFAVRYFEFDTFLTNDFVEHSSITNTVGFWRVSGELERTFQLEPGISYAIAVAPRGQTVQLAAPTAFTDDPGFRASNQNPDGAFPLEVATDQIARTPAITLLSPRGAAILGG